MAKQKKNGKPSATRKKPIVKVTCEICGETFEAAAQAKQCARCKRLVRKYYVRQQMALRRNDVPGMESARDYAVRMARAEARGKAEPETAGVQEQEIARCKYCGRPIKADPRSGYHHFRAKGGYCGACRWQGLDNVHRVTGRTSWDRKQA